MTDKSIVLPELSYKIMGALFTVHTELGPSLKGERLGIIGPKADIITNISPWFYKLEF